MTRRGRRDEGSRRAWVRALPQDRVALVLELEYRRARRDLQRHGHLPA